MAGDLVWMVKGGERLPVHPTCVADHKRLGWQVDDTPPEPQPIEEATATAPEAPKRRGRPPKSSS